ncbi:MAG: hypothetical protein WC926_04930 [Candidatus Paceibacterota bacterium]
METEKIGQFGGSVILPCITTTKKANPMAMVEEAKNRGLKEVGLFATAFDVSQRKELYKALEEAGLKIPFVHLRHDFNGEEVEYLIRNFGAKVLNLHAAKERKFIFLNELHKYSDKIFIENSATLPERLEPKRWAGLCFDIAHCEDWKRRLATNFDEVADLMSKSHWKKWRKTACRGLSKWNWLLSRYPVGVVHISAVQNATHPDEGGLPEDRYDCHVFKELSDFDYLKNYAEYSNCPYLVMELTNPIREQLRAIEYIKSFWV